MRTTYDARSYSDGNWHHVVKRVTGSSQELYVDGDLKLTTPRVGGTLTSPDDAFIIGTKPNAGALDWIGLTVKPVAAYAMRRLFGDYGGPQVGIRRSSDDMEANVFFDLYGKVMLVEDVNGGTSRTLEGWLGGATGKVHTWYDQSGNMHHGAGILPPTLINSGSFWSVNFNGTDECFEIPHNEQFNITDSGLSIVSNVMYQDNSNSFIFEKGPVNSQYNIYLNSTEVVFRTTTVNVLRVEFLPVDAPFFTSDTSISTSDTAWNETPLVNGWEASASSFADTGGFIYFHWKGMNGVTESINDAWLPELGTSFPQWLEIKFPVPVLLKSYRITSRNSGSDTRFPSVWRTQGFQGDSWIDLEDADRTESTWDAQVTKVYASGFNHGHTRFARYRLLVKEARKSTSDSTVNEVIIADWNLQVESPQYDVGLVSPKVRLDENTFSPVPNPAFTSNTTVDVTGTAWDNTYQDRDLRIYWRADASTYTTVFLPWKGFNKTVVDVDDCWLSQGIDTVSTSHPQWLSVQYPVAVRVTSYSITSRNDANNTRYPTNWILQGKERSGGWTDLETLERTASSWSASETKSYDNGFLSDRSSYREYRLFITGNSSDDQYVAIGDWTLNVQRVDAASFDNWYGSDVDLDVWYDQGSSKNDIIAFDTIKPTVRFNATKRAYNVTFEVRDGANTNNGSGIVTRRPVSKYVVDSPMYIVHDISINAFPDGGEGDAGYLYSFPTSLIPSPRTDRISTTNSLHKTDNIASSASNFVYAGDIGQRGTHTFAFRGDGDATYYSDQEQIRTSPINNIVGVEAGHWATNNYDWGTIGCELYESYLVPFPRTSPTGPPRSIRQKTAAISTFVLLDGSTPHLANASAFHIRRDVLAAGFSESYLKKLSGPRWIDPAFFSGRSTVRNPIRVYCDMITEGGGWTLIIKYDRDNATTSDYSLGRDGGRSHVATHNMADLDALPSDKLFASVDARDIIRCMQDPDLSPVSSYESLMMHCCTDVAKGARPGDYTGHSFNEGPLPGFDRRNTVSYSPLFSGFHKNILTNPTDLWNTEATHITNADDSVNTTNDDTTAMDYASQSDIDQLGGGVFWRVGTPEVQNRTIDVYGGSEDQSSTQYTYVVRSTYNDGQSHFSAVNRNGSVMHSGGTISLAGHAYPKFNWGWYSADGSQMSYDYGNYAIGTHCNSSLQADQTPAKRMNYMFIR